MAKFHGYLGYVHDVQTSPGVWEQISEEVECFGDILRNTRNWVPNQRLNEDIIPAIRVSVIADPSVVSIISHIRYVSFAHQGYALTKFRVSNVDVEHPRVIFTLGDVYNDGP